MGRSQTLGGARHGEESDMGRSHTWGGVRHWEEPDMGRSQTWGGARHGEESDISSLSTEEQGMPSPALHSHSSLLHAQHSIWNVMACTDKISSGVSM